MFSYIRKAQYHETDQMGIIHHANYVKWMEEARIEYLKSNGIDYKQIEKEGIASPVVEINVKYVRPVEFDDAVEIRVNVLKYSGAVIEFSYEFYNRMKDEICVNATSKHCFIQNGRPTSLKKFLPESDSVMRKLLENKTE